MPDFFAVVLFWKMFSVLKNYLLKGVLRIFFTLQHFLPKNGFDFAK